MSDWGPPNGFAVRRNGTSCLQGEVHCTKTWNLTSTSQNFHRCCPSGTSCGTEHVGVCCRDAADCTQTISDPAHCANETWNLFENGDSGYFCCEQGTDGFVRPNVGVGCAKEGDPTSTDMEFLTVVSSGIVATSTSSSTSNTGAIAGGVVGGVAVLAIVLALLWYFMRRHSQKQPPQAETPITEAPVIQYDPVQSSGKPSELDGQGYVAELGNTPVHELPENLRTR